MSLQSLTPEAILSLLDSENELVFNVVAAGALFFWEFCITFNQEINLVWRRRWGAINYLFVILRYGGFGIRIVEVLFYANLSGLLRPSRTVCQNWVKLEVVAGHLLLLAVDILLATRTYAFYGRERKMLYLLSFIVIAGQIAAIAIIIIVMPGFVSIPSPLPPTLHVGACIVLAADPRFPNYLVPTLVVESLLTFFVAAKFIHNKVTTKTPTPHMLMVFIRDGAWAFALVFGCLVWTVVTYKTDPLKGDIAITWLFTVLPFCGTRLVINLRSEAPGKNMFSDAIEIYPMTPMSNYSHDTPVNTNTNSKFESSFLNHH